MLLNSDQVEQFLQTNNLGSKAQVGYDLTLKSVNLIGGGTVTKDKTVVLPSTEVRPKKVGEQLLYELQPNTSYSLTFEQGIKLPNNVAAQIVHRSSVVRCGAIIISGVYDPGFETEFMGAILITSCKLTLEQGARVAQIIMHETHKADKYDGQWQSQLDVK